MKLTLVYTIFVLYVCKKSFCEKHLKQCNETIKSQICHINETYIKAEYPKPSPCQVDLLVNFKGIYDINEERNTISLFLRITTIWKDDRLNLYRNNEDIKM